MNSLVTVGAVALDDVVVEVDKVLLEVEVAIAGHAELPPAIYWYTSL